MTVVRRELPGVRDLLALAAVQPQRYPCLLESAAQGGRQARYDILFGFPLDALTLGSDKRVRDARGVDRGAHFLDALDEAWRAVRSGSDPSLLRHASLDVPVESLVGASCASTQLASNPGSPLSPQPSALPFTGGWVLYLGYELGAEIEPHVPTHRGDGALPIALALRCPAAVIVDRLEEKTWLVAEGAHAECLDAMEADLASAAAWSRANFATPQIAEDDASRFLDGVARVHEYLRAGDVFQVNLSREWRAMFARAPVPAELYARLRHANPAPFAGLLQWHTEEGQIWAVASSSPERLLETRGSHVQTRPIAGTRARIAGDDETARIRELIGHVKERAEHVMLIDLERNDLGRICVPGSVVVDELMAVESYAHVHHIVSNVCGQLRADITPAQAIRAVFPGGTITGAPKVRTMQIIHELEDRARGAYTGALGYLNHNGDMDLNVLIRTLEQHDRDVRLRAGAGIVADSNAQHELEETCAKARGLLRALGAAE
jgi:anthranilate synthase component 1